MRNDILERQEEILQWIAENQPKTYMCRQLQCKPETLNSYLQKLGIEYKGKQGWSKGQQVDSCYVPVEQYIKNSYVKSHILKQKLIREGYKKPECELCGASIWQGVQLPLELHHIDCNHYNNELSNLMILCPNCHSIQEGNSGANIRKKINYKLIQPNEKKKNYCIDCGKEISSGSKRCIDCYHKSTKIEHYDNDNHIMKNTGLLINREELKALIRTTSFVQIGKQYNVSDNAVRKWCDKFGLPRKASEIKNISDKDWEKI